MRLVSGISAPKCDCLIRPSSQVLPLRSPQNSRISGKRFVPPDPARNLGCSTYISNLSLRGREGIGCASPCLRAPPGDRLSACPPLSCGNTGDKPVRPGYLCWKARMRHSESRCFSTINGFVFCGRTYALTFTPRRPSSERLFRTKECWPREGKRPAQSSPCSESPASASRTLRSLYRLRMAGLRTQKQATTPACYGTIWAIKRSLRDTGNKLPGGRVAWSSLRWA